MSTVQQILKQQDNYSQLSVDASFTLQDILLQPPDEQVQIYNNIDQLDNFDQMFQDQMFQNQAKQTQQNKVSDSKNIQQKVIKQNNISVPDRQQQKIQSKVEIKSQFIKRGTKLQNLPLPPLQQIRNMVYIVLKNVSQLFDINNSQAKGVGVATCISSSGNKYLALGTSIGNIVIFQIGVKDYKILNTPDQNKYGQVTSISVSRDNLYLVAGYQTGLVTLWSLNNYKLIKTIFLQKNRILKALFCSENYQNFITSDSEGYIYMYTIQNYLWVGVKSQLLIDKSQNVYYDIKYNKIKSGKQILALSTYNSVLLISLKPTVTILGSIQRPDGIGSNKIPNCQIGEGQIKKQQKTNTQNNNNINNTNININVNTNTNKNNRQDYVCVSWSKYIYVYKLIWSSAQNQKIQLDFIMQQTSGIHNMQFITSGILVTLDSRQIYRVINLQQTKNKQLSLQQNSTNNTNANTRNSQISLSSNINSLNLNINNNNNSSFNNNQQILPCSYINITPLQTETIYQRFLKDKDNKYMKCYSNTIVSCNYNPRYKQIFLIAKNSIYRGRLQKWTDYVLYLLKEQKNWEMALKLCIQLYKGNYNIFAQQFIVNKTTINLLCEIGSIFFKQRMKDIQSKRRQLNSIKQVQQQVKQLFEVTIQYFSIIDCQDYMFNNIYKILKQNYFYAYQPQFISCLQPFIQQSLINKISNRDVFIRIIEYYTSKPQLLNIFITSLSEQSIYYSDIVQICARQKLYQALFYICSVSGDFISPANKIIQHLQNNPNDILQYTNLKNYLNKLIELKYPNDKPIIDRRNSMLVQICIWLGCDETLQYMLKNYNDDYFLWMSKLCKKLLQFDLINQIPTLANNLIQRIDIIRKQRLLTKLVDFIVQIGLSNKIHYGQQLLKKILDEIIQMYNTYNSTQIRKQLKYTNILKFIQKYLLDKHDSIKNIKQQYQQKLLNKLNIWVRITYKMLAQYNRQQILKQSPQLLRNQDPGRDYSIGYLLDNSNRYRDIISKYQDLIIQWSPQQSLLYILKIKGNDGIKQINNNIMKINDEKLKYAIVRKILRILRYRNKQILAPGPNNQVREIIKTSIMNLGTQTSQNVANQIIQTTLNDKILLFYMTSICKYKKQKRVFYQLIQNQQQYKSIITQLVPIMSNYNYRSCMGFIYQQQLRYKDAFTEYAAVYTQYFNMNFIKLVNHQYSPGRFMAKIYHIMLDLCYRIKKQQQWGLLIAVILTPLQKKDITIPNGNARVIDTVQKIYQIKSSKQHPFLQQLVDLIEMTLTSMSREVSINLMGIQLNKYTDLLTKSFVVNCLTSTLRGCSKRVQTFQISKKLMVAQFVNQFQDFFDNNKIHGSTTDNICDQCGLQANNRNYNKNIHEIKFQVLKCGHGYHQKCFMKNYCKCKICTRKLYGDIQQDKIQETTHQKKADPKLSKIRAILSLPDNAKVDDDQQRTQQVYRYLAFQDYLHREEENYQNFRAQFQDYITKYKQK